MIDQPSELRRLLAHAIPDVSIDTGHLLDAIVARLDAMASAQPGDFERRVETEHSKVIDAGLAYGTSHGAIKEIIRRAIRAEDRVAVLESALKTIRFCARAADEKGDAWAKIVLKAVDETRAALSAEPRK